jgi:hypothetical protein
MAMLVLLMTNRSLFMTNCGKWRELRSFPEVQLKTLLELLTLCLKISSQRNAVSSDALVEMNKAKLWREFLNRKALLNASTKTKNLLLVNVQY